ncbi:hypothetical protein SH449x_000349 [Pirellulaceae bacterium SH449]
MTERRPENICIWTLRPSRLCILFTVVVSFGWFGQTGHGQQQFRTPSQSTRIISEGKANQRWIPIDRRKLGELGRLGEILQNTPPAAEQNPLLPAESVSSDEKSRLPFDLSKVDLRSLENQLANLTPEQRERLKQLAKQYSESQMIRDLATSVKELPSSLVEQIRDSQSLREFAKDILDGEEAVEAVESLGSPFEIQDAEPWIKFDPANSSLRPLEDAAANSQPTVNANDSAQAATAIDSKAADNSSVSRKTSSTSKASQQAASDSVTRSNEPIPRRADQASARKPGISTPSINLPPKASDKNSSFKTQNSHSTGKSADQGSTIPPSKNETAFDSFRRRVAELGLGQTLERLTKEAVGIEQKRAEDSNIAVNSSKNDGRFDRRSIAVERSSQNTSNPTRSREDEVNQFVAPNFNEASRTGGSNTESTRAKSMPRSTVGTDAVTPPPSTASKQPSVVPENVVPSWRAPSWDDLPSFSFLQIGGILLVVVLVVGILFMNRAPELARAAQHKRREMALKVSLMEMEISNREQVVLAFDAVAAQKISAFEDWWTAQRVVTHATERNMDITPKLQTAAAVYSRARYSPPDRGLSEDELTAVRDAIRACVKTRSIE